MVKEEKLKSLQDLKKLGLKTTDQLKGIMCNKV